MRRPSVLLLLGLVIAVVVWIAWLRDRDDDAHLKADEKRHGSHAASLRADGDDACGRSTGALARADSEFYR